ncbi:MAG: DUF1289 domain-containing protein [Pseudomonadota bacterium]
MSEVIPSPCVNICVIDAAGQTCVGCYRTLDEIARWATMPAAERNQIMDALDARMEAAFEDG